MQEYQKREAELNFDVVTWKRDTIIPIYYTKNRKVFMCTSERDTCSTQVSSLASRARRAETNRVEMETGFRLSIRPRTLLARLCREKSKKNAEKILATGIRSFEPASTPLRMRDILSVWWTSGLNIDVILCHTNFWDFYEKYFGCTRFVRDSEISWFILLDIQLQFNLIYVD